MKGIAFVSGKFRGKNHWEIHLNVLKAEAAVPKLLKMGYAPIVPHKLTENMQGYFPDKTYLDMCIEIINALRPGRDVIFMLKGWKKSEGAREELEAAKKRWLTVIYE